MRGSVRSAKWWARDNSWSAVMVILLGASVSRRRITRKSGPFTTFRRPISRFLMVLRPWRRGSFLRRDMAASLG